MLSLFCGRAQAQEVSNLDFLINLTDSLLVSVLDAVNLTSNLPVRIRSLSKNDRLDWFIEGRLVEQLRNKKIDSIYLNHDHSDSTAEIEFTGIDIGIEYLTENTQTAIKNQVKRTGRVQFYLRVVLSPSGRIMWNQTLSGTKSDWIVASRIKLLENPNVAFTKGMSQFTRSSNKLLQAVIITSVSGIIVYLFYSLRSR